MIVVCPNTIVSKLVYDWISGQSVERPDGSEALRSGALPLLSNVGDDGCWIGRNRTILVDSAQLESGEAMKDDFKKARSEEHTSELQSLMRISYAVFCLKKKKKCINTIQ